MDKKTALEISTLAVGIALPLSEALKYYQPDDPFYNRNIDLVRLLVFVAKDPTISESLTDDACSSLCEEILAAIDQATAVAPGAFAVEGGNWPDKLKATALVFCDALRNI